MLKLAQFLSYKDITVLVGNIEGPYGWSLHVCLAPAGGPKARDGHHICGSTSNRVTKDNRDRLNLT